jgi:hypothetical protein
VNGWATTGWCFVATDLTQLTPGHAVTLVVSLCRDGTSQGAVRFDGAQQAAWSLSNGHTLLWTSNDRPGAFKAGEVVTLQPQQCLRWQATWRVTAHGRPIPAGRYMLSWGTGADVRDARGRGYHDASSVQVTS